MANRDDWALAVGITEYPDINGLSPLDGAEDDALDFLAWVTDPTGGAVPDAQAQLLVTSQFHPPAPPHNGRAPSRNLVDDWCKRILHKDGAGRAGRRLYLYFSCHGFAPSTNDIACLTADATDLMFSHVHCNGWADAFYQLGKFDEIVLFADCCRTSIRQAPLVGTGVSDVSNKAGIGERKRFYGLAAPVNQKAMQVPDREGNPRGVFTMALMDGLRGKAADPGTGEVGSASLKNFMNNFTRDYLPPELSDHADKIDPDIDDKTEEGDQIVFCTPNQNKGRIGIDLKLPDGVENGTSIMLLRSQSGTAPTVVATGQSDNGTCGFDLHCGHYLALIGTVPFNLSVSPTGNWKLENGGSS